LTGIFQFLRVEKSGLFWLPKNLKKKRHIYVFFGLFKVFSKDLNEQSSAIASGA
jgi:hypothetical protein